MKLSDTFDQNPSCPFDKIREKPILMENALTLDLESKGQGHSKNQKPMPWGTKIMPPKQIRAGVPLVIGVTWTPTSVKQYVGPHPMGGSTWV